jgi:hypothetical protein
LNTLVSQVAELAAEVEITDPVDWGYLRIDEKDTYELIASQVIEMYTSTPKENREVMALATMTKLVVENMVLNTKLTQR